jgi:hypothetical protein
VIARRRRPLSNVGGPVAYAGDPDLANRLGHALAAVDGDGDAHVHGFHSYPARMHPGIAAALLDEFARPGDVLLDPFCGSGTVLVEGRLRGLRCLGADLNPIAVRLARLKTNPGTARERTALREAAQRVVAASTERVRERRREPAPLPASEREWYEPHVLAELAGLWAEVRATPGAFVREALTLVFSAIVVKLSRQEADTVARVKTTRVRKGFATDFFGRKTAELVDRMDALASRLPRGAPPAEVIAVDARDVGGALGDVHFDLVITSPPYAGTYDYVDHHARRLAWLGGDIESFEDGELGARRHLAEGGERRWNDQLRAVLEGLRGGAQDHALLLLLCGDGEIGDRRIDANEQLRRLAPRAGLRWLGAASQLRDDFRGGPPRGEHLVALGVAAR